MELLTIAAIIALVLVLKSPPKRVERADYEEYLRSDEWHEKREKALWRADYRCERCGSEERLEVHHLNYDRLGHERMSDLVVLCDDCHGQADSERRG